MPTKFSEELEVWLKSRQPKTIQSLLDVFGEKSFAIVVMILMFFPALPIPTGGITHLLELIVMLVALQMMVGRRTLWLPKRVLQRPLGEKLTGKAVPFILKEVKWFEKYSRPRFGQFINHRLTYVFVGIIFFLLALGAAVAPPFTGIDTIPSLAAVMICLALILDDALLFIAGAAISIIGFIVTFLTGQATLNFVLHYFGR